MYKSPQGSVDFLQKMDVRPGKHLKGMRFIKKYILFYKSPQESIYFLQKKWMVIAQITKRRTKSVQITTRERRFSTKIMDD